MGTQRRHAWAIPILVRINYCLNDSHREVVCSDPSVTVDVEKAIEGEELLEPFIVSVGCNAHVSEEAGEVGKPDRSRAIRVTMIANISLLCEAAPLGMVRRLQDGGCPPRKERCGRGRTSLGKSYVCFRLRALGSMSRAHK